ncbi:MAG: hypothetical protein IKZ90_09120 [Clostridiales bacterium]|nr:hypothetical protein [Clostridiales bacterium]
MSIFDEVNTWEKTKGASIFSSILQVSDPVILDYGCGDGNYSFSAAYAFGQKCKVYAVDSILTISKKAGSLSTAWNVAS